MFLIKMPAFVVLYGVYMVSKQNLSDSKQLQIAVKGDIKPSENYNIIVRNYQLSRAMVF